MINRSLGLVMKGFQGSVLIFLLWPYGILNPRESPELKTTRIANNPPNILNYNTFNP